MRARTVVIAILVLMSCLLFALSGYYMYQMGPVSDSDTVVEVEIPSGTSVKGIGKILEEKKLIHSANFFYFYVKLHGSKGLKASTYELKENMGLLNILEMLEGGNTYNPDVVQVTFKEGLNMRGIGKVLEEKTNISYDEFLSTMKDREYISKFIDEYWFLTDEIMDENIYYPLEGYLFPNTYQFRNKDVTIDEVVRTMLKETDVVLSEYKEEISNHAVSVHDFLTLASVVELEGTTDEFRSGIAQVFYNRLDIDMSLGSDVTTYYAFEVDMNERDLTKKEFDTYNPYNTRGPQMGGKLPIGPVCNPSRASILASIEPDDTKRGYYYFVADKHRQVYFTKTEKEHNKKVQEIKDKGDWITW